MPRTGLIVALICCGAASTFSLLADEPAATATVNGRTQMIRNQFNRVSAPRPIASTTEPSRVESFRGNHFQWTREKLDGNAELITIVPMRLPTPIAKATAERTPLVKIFLPERPVAYQSTEDDRLPYNPDEECPANESDDAFAGSYDLIDDFWEDGDGSDDQPTNDRFAGGRISDDAVAEENGDGVGDQETAADQLPGDDLNAALDGGEDPDTTQDVAPTNDPSEPTLIEPIEDAQQVPVPVDSDVLRLRPLYRWATIIGFRPSDRPRAKHSTGAR